jgi:hypothetical protein
MVVNNLANIDLRRSLFGTVNRLLEANAFGVGYYRYKTYIGERRESLLLVPHHSPRIVAA